MNCVAIDYTFFKGFRILIQQYKDSRMELVVKKASSEDTVAAIDITESTTAFKRPFVKSISIDEKEMSITVIDRESDAELLLFKIELPEISMKV